MCGRVIRSSAPFRLAIVEGLDVRSSRFHNYPPHWNGAPSQELLVIRRNYLDRIVLTVIGRLRPPATIPTARNPG